MIGLYIIAVIVVIGAIVLLVWRHRALKSDAKQREQDSKR